MGRFLLAALASAAIGSLAAPAVAGAQSPAQDSVTGMATAGVGRLSVDFAFDVRSGPSGQSPTGTVGFDSFLVDLGDLEVSCLTVSYNRASMVVLIPPAPNAPAGAVISVEDNGAGVEDRVGWHFVTPAPTECPVPTTVIGEPIRAGDIAVTDAQPSVDCGQVITEDTRLDGDLRCDSEYETALTIGAPGITLDLGGHTVLAAQEAIRNERHDDVTIRNGTLITDEGAVHLAHVTGNVIRNVEARGLLAGITLVDADHSRIVDNDVAGVFLTLTGGSDWNTISRNVVSRYESGINISGSSHNRIVDNISWTVEDSPLVMSRAHRNVVRRNTLLSGFAYSGPLAIVRASNRNDFAHNLIVSYGIYRGSGIRLDDSNRNAIRHNTLRGTPLGVWVRSGAANELRANTAEGTPSDEFDGEQDGFLVALAAQRTVLERNRASGFADDGFDIRDGRAQAGRNEATDNGDFGIDATPGVVDLGGNRASGNGGPEQCRGVICR